MKKPKAPKAWAPTQLQKAVMRASLDSTPQTPMSKIATKAGASTLTIERWFSNPEFEHWWLRGHLKVNRTMFVEKIVRAICIRAVRPSASAKDRELALQILAPEQLNRAKILDRPQVVINFVDGARKLDMPQVSGTLPPEPALIEYIPDKGEEILEVEADVA